MTDRERALELRCAELAEIIAALGDRVVLTHYEEQALGLLREVAPALSAARQEERERAAAIALNCRPKQSLTALKWSPPFSVGYEAACEDIEQAIRARGEAGR
jgi:hypothetical protein